MRKYDGGDGAEEESVGDGVLRLLPQYWLVLDGNRSYDDAIVEVPRFIPSRDPFRALTSTKLRVTIDRSGGDERRKDANVSNCWTRARTCSLFLFVS